MYLLFVPNFTEIASPLKKLLNNGQSVNLEPFGNAEVSAFTALMKAVTSTPILALPHPGLPFEVNTDARANQGAFALFEVSEDRVRHR